MTAEPQNETGDYVADVGFDELGMSPALREAVRERGYEKPTPVQARVWVPARAGKDLIVRSKTGTGKTAAFGMPIIDRIAPGTRNVKALILCPTRELAVQVREELASLAVRSDISVTALYGGDSIQRQQDALKSGSAIVVGTPGRVLDHLRRGTLKVDAVAHAVLDEADEMLNQGFYEDVTKILDTLPRDRQILLFSATVPAEFERLVAQYTQSPETLLLSGDDFTVDHIRHIRYEISDAYPKPRNLLYLLELENPENAIVFCNTRDDTELVTAVLNRNGFDAELLNGELAQKERERVMGRVKRGELAFMVATDLAARGIDISDLAYVINYSLPEDPAVYLHRVGRTGRIGKRGTAINLTSGKELSTLTALEQRYGIEFEQRKMPTQEEAQRMWTERHVASIKDAAQSLVYEGFLGLASSLRARSDADELVAVLLRSFFVHRRIELAKAQQPEPEPKKPSAKGKRGASADPDSPRGRRRRDENGDARRSPRVPRDLEPPANPAPATPRHSDRALFEELASSHGKANDGAIAGTLPVAPPERERPRRDRGERVEAPVEAGFTRLWINLGAADQVRDAKNLSAALEQLGAPSGKIGHTDVRRTFSYIDVSDSDAGTFCDLAGKKVHDKSVKIEVARR